MNARYRRFGACALVVAEMLSLVSGLPVETEATWTDAELSTGAGLQAGTVTAPTGLQCSAGLGILAPVTFTWTAPATGGLTRGSYRWSVSGSLTGSGVLAAAATSVSISTALLVGTGTGTFRLYAVGPGGWESTPVSGTITFIAGLASVCSVP